VTREEAAALIDHLDDGRLSLTERQFLVDLVIGQLRKALMESDGEALDNLPGMKQIGTPAR
jgi:hypothetical protein